ncbi:MAG: DUF3795 domain-containing protein [Atopobiaceae bacterium]|jgi:hypothetical protein|nr:DUF3795 domain-containing protein [Atopobiaceae bacterium]MCI2174126.1 DUF3795 domain-containing protein [Atopobiaceae bacterium]MCI2206767.1 DUF3795 domain-containing protein [Atopobiaceae bacterium]
MKETVGCCGLDCERCDAYVATVNDDDALREKTAELWSEMNHASITKSMIDCLGCRADGPKTPYCESLCEIRKCVRRKGFDTCGDCDELEGCETVGMVIGGNPDALANLKDRD